MSSYAKRLAATVNPNLANQTEAIPGREAEMVKNNAGGFVFQVDAFTALNRFLILGTETSTYYQNAKDLTKQNVTGIIRLLETNGIDVVKRVIEVSQNGLAYKNDQALFVMALASNSSNLEVRRFAMDNLAKVARTGTHLFMYAEFVNGIRGWGRALKRSVGNWYNEKDVTPLAYQLVKYQQRNGWSNRDLLRLAHPKTDDEVRNEMYKWATKGAEGADLSKLPLIIQSFEAAKHIESESEIVKLIVDGNLPREAIPTKWLNSKAVWEALLESMPLTAMIRNLNKMTSIGLIAPLSKATTLVKTRLADQDYIAKSRVHPLALVQALLTYRSGRGNLGSLTWDAVPAVTSALDSAFYLAFKNVVPTNKPTLLALDVSGSMGWSNIGNVPGFTPAFASAAMALVTAKVEPNCHVMAFSHQLVPVDITEKDTLSSLGAKLNAIRMGGTDCSLPMTWAEKNKIEVDNFAVYTDNETYFGRVHPSVALKNYRKALNRQSRLAVIGMTATNFTIADPKDPGMMDFVGFDSSAPAIMSNFFEGKI